MANELLTITGIRVRIDIKTIRESGGGTSSATLPTTVTFTKTFADIRSIQVTAMPSTPGAYFAIVDFTDVPNPTSFDVYIYDSAGTQVASDFTWTAEGIQGV